MNIMESGSVKWRIASFNNYMILSRTVGTIRAYKPVASFALSCNDDV